MSKPMWCDENNIPALKPRSFTEGVIAVAGRCNSEHCNHVTNAAGRRVRGFLGIEAVTKAGHMHSMNFDSVRTYVHDGWD